MDIGGVDSSMQALQVLGVDQQVRANNVANVSTEGFEPSRVDLESGPEGWGVRVAAINQESGSSGTDIAREMVGMIETQNAFAANTAMIRAWDETTGYLVNLKV